MYTLLPRMEPDSKRRIEPIVELPLMKLPMTKHQLVQDYLLKTSSTKDNYYVDINPRPTHVINAPLQKVKQVEKGSSVKPEIKQKYKTMITQTLPNFEDHDCPKKNTLYPKKRASSPKTGKREPEVEKTDIKETKSTSKDPKLQEIRFIKNEFGKQMIAKYHSKNDNSSNSGEDNLIIVWNEQNIAQVLTYKGKDPRRYVMGHCFPHEKSAFRVHNFRRTECTKKSAKKMKGKR